MNLVVVSNRLPFALARDEQGGTRIEPASGGLITALRPVLQDRGGRWIGWTGTTNEEMPDAARLIAEAHQNFGYELVPLTLTQQEKEGFYYGFSNEVVWPLFHDLPSLCRFEPSYWEAYQTVNRKYAETAVKRTQPDDFIWIHDYHLMTVARELRRLGVKASLALFLHIPFPGPDIFLKLPWRFQILQALLEHDLIGFQTMRDRRNFLNCVRLLWRDAEVPPRGGPGVARVQVGRREVRVGAFPISIDFTAFDRWARERAVVAKAESLRAEKPGRKVVLGVDRLDYTKGIPGRLRAYRYFLERYPEHQGKVTYVQVVVPSREDIPRYRDQKIEIERLVGEINGQFTRRGWVPIHYIYRALDGPRLPAYYLAADVALVTPLRDGMNLVAKEYCATRVQEDGVLVLSEFAGAAAQLQRGALLVNPFDIEGVAATLDRALKMPIVEQRARMKRLRREIRDHDIFRWLDAFLEVAIAHDLSVFPRLEEYVPEPAVLDE